MSYFKEEFSQTIDRLLDRYCEPAIMCYRPFIERRQTDNLSKLGGLPRLPENVEWPCATDGLPFHHLTTINLSELPQRFDELPKTGVLYFFARIDEEMGWEDYSPKDTCRIVFGPEIGPVDRQAPENLPAIAGGKSEMDREFKLEDEEPTRVFPTWPLEFLTINSWPDASALCLNDSFPNEFHWAYDEAVRQHRLAEVIRVTGIGVEASRTPKWGKSYRKKSGELSVSLPMSLDGRKFPFAWIVLGKVCRAILTNGRRRLDRELRQRVDPARDDQSNGVDAQEQFELLAEAARKWVKEADKNDPFSVVPPDLCEKYCDWLLAAARNAKDWMRHVIGDAIDKGMKSAISIYCGSPYAPTKIDRQLKAGGDPGVIPQSLLWDIQSAHSPTRHHQMLGNAVASQWARPVRRAEHLLLQLNTDDGVGFMFSDCGEANFWIDHCDLQNMRFENTWVSTDGG